MLNKVAAQTVLAAVGVPPVGPGRVLTAGAAAAFHCRPAMPVAFVQSMAVTAASTVYAYIQPLPKSVQISIVPVLNIVPVATALPPKVKSSPTQGVPVPVGSRQSSPKRPTILKGGVRNPVITSPVVNLGGASAQSLSISTPPVHSSISGEVKGKAGAVVGLEPIWAYAPALRVAAEMAATRANFFI